ncbi:hypothetical protein HAX54_049076 [Datura stramonium]|uniref:Uncharacterized protein n=1 Tax=Datura stramonium TaxID=4076 RepID=A0ABS8SV53_DATST|nr:hypothetical protein [Datura stramonium]
MPETYHSNGEDDTGCASGRLNTQRLKPGNQRAQVPKSLILWDMSAIGHVVGTGKPTNTAGLGRAREKQVLGLNEKKGGEWTFQASGERANLRIVGPDYAAQVIFNKTQGELVEAQAAEELYDISGVIINSFNQQETMQSYSGKPTYAEALQITYGGDSSTVVDLIECAERGDSRGKGLEMEEEKARANSVVAQNPENAIENWECLLVQNDSSMDEFAVLVLASLPRASGNLAIVGV